ncbi:MAG: type VI secretion system baseplate subunit TssE [Pirellulaceae bacterium]|nr:type VI secretion system baseplate subunit TssE [Pirellulaceae bacterium]
MAELTPSERLQPSLLDRLTDDEPLASQEPRSRRVLSIQRLRESVLRDLGWLLNTTNMADDTLADRMPNVAQSVLNYGLPDLAGLTSSSINVGELERLVLQAIWDFEPRILRHTLKVVARTNEDTMNLNALVFEITGELWAQPVPLELFLKTEVDLESGDIVVTEMGR